MSFLAPTGAQWRTPQYGKSVIVSTSRGVLRVQAWPRKRGLPKTKPEQNRLSVFSLYQRLIKWLAHWETNYARKAIAEHNRTHRGQRGSAAIRFRDWQTQRLYGRGVAVTTDENIVFYPAAVSRDASFIMDHTTSDNGQISQRASSSWGSIAGGNSEDLLYSAGAGNPNYWAPPP